ncbi:hypothetical protein HVB34_004518 [Salmonella enterica]|nr:hypothetical protein [Salmonella enterica]
MKMESKTWNVVGSFKTGCRVENPWDVVTEDDGTGWRFDGDLPHEANVNSFLTDGFGVGGWIHCFGDTPTKTASFPYLIVAIFLLLLILKII